jgi:hypothetical protein
VGLDYYQVFLFAPFLFLYVGAQVIVPSEITGILPFSALLADSSGNKFSDFRPIFGSFLLNYFQKKRILLLIPWTFLDFIFSNIV